MKEYRKKKLHNVLKKIKENYELNSVEVDVVINFIKDEVEIFLLALILILVMILMMMKKTGSLHLDTYD